MLPKMNEPSDFYEILERIHSEIDAIIDYAPIAEYPSVKEILKRVNDYDTDEVQREVPFLIFRIKNRLLNHISITAFEAVSAMVAFDDHGIDYSKSMNEDYQGYFLAVEGYELGLSPLSELETMLVLSILPAGKEINFITDFEI